MKFEDTTFNNSITHDNVSPTREEIHQCKEPWHSPTITRIDICRTLSGSGSVTDGNFAFTPI